MKAEGLTGSFAEEQEDKEIQDLHSFMYLWKMI
jgi:hypothetical protein